MSALDEVIRAANDFRETPSLCVVELAPETFVVTATVEQADTLRAFLAEGVGREPQAEGHPSVADAPAAGSAVDEVADEPAVAPVKRGPGRPRKQSA